MPTSRVFLLSPASCSGERAALLLREQAAFDLARRVRTAAGVPLGDVYTFLSGLYFRGKIAYARAFARAPRRLPGAYVITPTRGLLLPEQPVTVDVLREFAAVDLHAREARYREPLDRDAQALVSYLGPRCEVVLLGSIATGKYVDALLPVFGDRLRFPSAFVGRGDMSRGGLLLRCVREGRELDYVPLDGRSRHGSRPARLGPPVPRIADVAADAAPRKAAATASSRSSRSSVRSRPTRTRP